MTDTPDEDSHYFAINHTEIMIEYDGWLDYKNTVDWLGKVIRAMGCEQYSILLTNNAHIQTLNRDFRNKDKPTNVLSFPDGTDGYLGDIAIALETIEAESAEQDKDFYHHLTHMVVHGLLHLKGYDHETEKDATQMETLEIKILADINIENPYI